MSEKHGDQFSADRYTAGQGDIAASVLAEHFDARNIINVEPNEPYDNFAEAKELHQLVDYTGVDYVVDTMQTIFGVNNRVNRSDGGARFDLRSQTGTEKPSELEAIRKCHAGFDFGPKYATRVRKPDEWVEWVKIVDLERLGTLIEEVDLPPHKKWSDSDGVAAWLYEYDSLEKMDCVVAEYSGRDLQDLGVQ